MRTAHQVLNSKIRRSIFSYEKRSLFKNNLKRNIIFCYSKRRKANYDLDSVFEELDHQYIEPNKIYQLPPRFQQMNGTDFSDPFKDKDHEMKNNEFLSNLYFIFLSQNLQRYFQ